MDTMNAAANAAHAAEDWKVVGPEGRVAGGAGALSPSDADGHLEAEPRPGQGQPGTGGREAGTPPPPPRRRRAAAWRRRPFALLLTGTALAPRFCNGDRLTICPSREPRPGDVVVAQVLYARGEAGATEPCGRLGNGSGRRRPRAASAPASQPPVGHRAPPYLVAMVLGADGDLRDNRGGRVLRGHYAVAGVVLRGHPSRDGA